MTAAGHEDVDMPLSAHEQRILAVIEDELIRQDPQLAEQLTHRPPPSTWTQPVRHRLGARWAAVPFGLAVWALVVALVALSGVGLVDAALIVTAFVMVVGVHLARFFARRALYRRFGSAAYPDRDRHREH